MLYISSGIIRFIHTYAILFDVIIMHNDTLAIYKFKDSSIIVNIKLTKLQGDDRYWQICNSIIQSIADSEKTNLTIKHFIIACIHQDV